MARHYVLGCWANADEYDYSGEQLMGHRKGKSICMDHMLPSGMANLSRYGDPVEQPKSKKKSVADSIDLAERHYQRMEKMSEQLDEEYFAGELEEERYQLLRYKMDERLTKAWKRLEKDNSPIWNKLDESYEIESFYHQEHYNTNIQSKKTLTEGDHFINLVFNGLPDDNVFKAGFLFIQKMMRVFR